MSKRGLFGSDGLTDELSETDPTYAEPDSCLSTWEQLQSSSCELEASEFAHDHVTGFLMHEIFCEVTKLLRYVSIAAENVKSELGLELLFDLERQGKRVISLKRLLFDESLHRTIIHGLIRINRFSQSSENLEYLSAIVKRCVPFVHIRETWERLNVAVSNFFVYIVRFLQDLEHRLRLRPTISSDADSLVTLREEIVAVEKETLHSIGECFLNRFGGNAVPFVKSVFAQVFAREPFHPYFAILKELAGILCDLYSGYHASGFQQHIIAPTRNFVSVFLADFFPDVHRTPPMNWILNNGQDLSASIIRSGVPWSSFISKKLQEIPIGSFFSSSSEISLMAANANANANAHTKTSFLTDDWSSSKTVSPHVFRNGITSILSDYSINSPATASGTILHAFATDSLSSPTSTPSGASIDNLSPVFIANTHSNNKNSPSVSASEILSSEMSNLQSSSSTFPSSFRFSPSLETATPLPNDATLSYPTSSGEVYKNFPFLAVTRPNHLPGRTFQTDSPSSRIETTVPRRFENIVIPYSVSSVPFQSLTNPPRSDTLVNAPQPLLTSLVQFSDNVSGHSTILVEEARGALLCKNSDEYSNYYVIP